MPDLVVAVPGSLDTPTGGYVYDRRVIAEARRTGLDVAVLDLGEGFPTPTEATRARAVAALGSVAKGVPVIVDGLALGVLPGAASTLARSNPLIALVHHPLALETGLTPPEQQIFRASEQAALSFARNVVVTSGPTADTLVADYGVDRDKITVAEPGTEPARMFSVGSGDDVVQLVSVGAVSPRKGYPALVKALAMIDEHKWRLTIAGATDRNPDAAKALKDLIRAEGLSRRIVVAGDVKPEVVEGLLQLSDAFVFASEYEGYGMAMAEAVAHGLPVVGTSVGAVPSFVTKESGLLVEPGDIAGLANALRAIVSEHDMRAGMARAARDMAEKLPRWGDTAAKILAVARRTS